MPVLCGTVFEKLRDTHTLRERCKTGLLISCLFHRTMRLYNIVKNRLLKNDDINHNNICSLYCLVFITNMCKRDNGTRQH